MASATSYITAINGDGLRRLLLNNAVITWYSIAQINYTHTIHFGG